MRRVWRVWVIVAAMLSVDVLAQPFPSRPLRIVVPFPPGAAADSALRIVAQRMSLRLGQPVLVRNHPGAPGVISVAQAEPDGYTLLLGTGSLMVTQPLLVERLAYSPAEFAPVGRILLTAPVLTTHPGLGVTTIRDLLAVARNAPGRLDYSSSGHGSPGHLAMEMFQALTGTSLVHIPYKGGAPAVNELMGGHVHMSINALPSVLEPIRQRRLVPLAIGGHRRSPLLPDVPTLSESGVPGFDYEIWYGLFAPAGTPEDVISRISQALQAALTDADLDRQLLDLGAEASPSSPRELAAYMERDRARWRRLIQEKRLGEARR